MSRDERKNLIERIERERDSKLICYVTGDRTPFSAQIGDDAVRPLYQHIRDLGKTPRLDLFLYSRGGAIDVPWRIVSALRSGSEEWNALIPFRANSAATLIAMGADSIILGAQGELGPIDPIMNLQRMVPSRDGPSTVVQDQISVEDVMAYVRFVQERGGISDQQARAGALDKLTGRVDPVALGNVYRTYSHIRDVARRILLSRKSPAGEDILNAIVSTLAERVYAHGHAIGFTAAHEIGLPVVLANANLDPLMWGLYEVYELDMKLRDPIDPVGVLSTQDRFTEPGVMAMIESTNGVDEFRGDMEVRAKRQMPANLQVSVNLNLQLPAGINLQQLPAQAQQVLQQLMQNLQQLALQQAQQAVQQALQTQAPLVGADASFRNGKWVRG
jgi:hypothetical protein